MMYDELVKSLREDHGKQYFARDMEAANAIEDLIVALTASNEVIAKSKQQWIPVTERLPEHSGDYLVYSVGGNWKQLSTIEIAFWNDKNFIVQSFFAVTHWMPLPQPPMEET